MSNNPSEGIVKYDGNHAFNYGKFLKSQQQSSLLYNTIYGNASVYSARFTVAGESTYWLRIEHNPLKEFYVFSKQYSVTQGLFNIDTVTGTPPIVETGATAGVAKYALNNGNTPTLSTLRINAAAPTDIVVKEYYMINVAQSIGHSGSANQIDHLVKIYSNDFWIRINKTDSGSSTINFTMIACEQ